jgi:hypothetical protein
MYPKNTLIPFAAFCLCAVALLLSGCGGDYNGYGEYDEGWGESKGFGDVQGYGFEQVGLCSYIGGCMPEDDKSSASSSGRPATDVGFSHSVPDHSLGGLGDTGGN